MLSLGQARWKETRDAMKYLGVDLELEEIEAQLYMIRSFCESYESINGFELKAVVAGLHSLSARVMDLRQGRAITDTITTGDII